MSNPVSLLLALLIVPFIWSALIQLIRHVAGQSPAIFHDHTEKAVMALMLLPVIVGLVFVMAAPMFAPLNRSHVFYPPVFEAVADVAVQALPQPTAKGPDLTALGIQAILGLYVAGLVFGLWRLWQSHSKLSRIVRSARPTASDDNVLCSELSPLAFAWGGQRIIVPSILLERLSAQELDLVLAHERAHQRRGDPVYFLTLSLIEAIFWFNPLFARQARACRLAAELDCDATAVGEGTESRRAYAQTLLTALKYLGNAKACSVPTFISDKESYQMRLSHIMTTSLRPRKAVARLAFMTLIAAPVLMLQMAFAEGRKLPVLEISATTPLDTVAKTDKLFAIAPVDSPVRSVFGIRIDPLTNKPRVHAGVDFDLALGTPVKAPASGTVTNAAVWGAYGSLVEIDHGNGVKTRYAHLDKALVKWGEKVSEGQVIALSGNSGKSTHPHLHFEVWQNEKPIDPVSVMALQAP